MAEKSSKKANKPLAADKPVKRSAAVFPVAKPAQTELSRAVVASAPKPTAPKTVNVTFALREPNAKQVVLAGDFNG